MQVQRVQNSNYNVNFGILKFKNGILKYEKEMNMVKNSKDIQKLVNHSEHKGMDVVVEFSDKEYTYYETDRYIPWMRADVSHKCIGEKVVADLYFYNKLGEYFNKALHSIDVTGEHLTGRKQLFVFDMDKIIAHFDKLHLDSYKNK